MEPVIFQPFVVNGPTHYRIRPILIINGPNFIRRRPIQFHCKFSSPSALANLRRWSPVEENVDDSVGVPGKK
ncbi:hypothetical protein Bca4012_075721 [Brassica carinata]